MPEKKQSPFASLYWRHFATIAGMVLLTMLLLGVSLFALSYTTGAKDKRSEMRSRAELIAQLSVDYFKGGVDESVDQDEALRKLADVSTRMTDVNFLICDATGHVLLTTDASLGGRAVTVPADITAAITDERLYEGSTTLAGTYTDKHVVVGVPIDTGDAMIGFVLAVVDMDEMLEMWSSFFGLFLMTSAIILLIAFVVSSLASMRQIQPITEMVQATRAYASGNFDVRMSDTARSDEFGELARSFNAMADSLQATERQRRDFIANVSHELKTPMTSIAGYTDGILDGTIPPEKERQYLQIISDESRRLSRLVRRMLDVSRLQSKEMKKVPFDICEGMRLSLLSMEQKILDRGLDVEADIPEEAVMVDGDKELLTQVVYNLLENAAKFAAPATALYLGLTYDHEQAVVCVRNHGATIPPEEIPLLFERFHKSDKSRSEDKDGYGLGLYVVKTIVEQHGEKVSVRSENGLTEFSFTVRRSRSSYEER